MHEFSIASRSEWLNLARAFSHASCAAPVGQGRPRMRWLGVGLQGGVTRGFYVLLISLRASSGHWSCPNPGDICCLDLQVLKRA